MARGKQVTYADYKALGDAHHLDLVGSVLPEKVTKPALWKCRWTGKTFNKTYNSIRISNVGSRFQTGWKEKVGAYAQLAKELGIEMCYLDPSNFKNNQYLEPLVHKFPTDTKAKTAWRSRVTKRVVYASYNELKWNTPIRVKKAFELEMEVA